MRVLLILKEIFGYTQRAGHFEEWSFKMYFMFSNCNLHAYGDLFTWVLCSTCERGCVGGEFYDSGYF